MKKLETIPSEQWPSLTAREVMWPVSREMFVHPQTLLPEAQNLLRENGLGSAAVLDDDGYIVGYITMSDIHTRLSA
jgi:CBS domain-containing protein